MSAGPTREEQVGGRCRHFTGTVATKCMAGVCYDDVWLNHDPIPYESRGLTYKSSRSLPCLRSHNHGGAVCALVAFPSPDEIAAIIERQDSGLRDLVTARKAIVAKLGPYVKRQSPDAHGSLACPVCTTGTLGYRRAALNGHIHARCSTEGCVAWME